MWSADFNRRNKPFHNRGELFPVNSVSPLGKTCRFNGSELLPKGPKKATNTETGTGIDWKYHISFFC